MQIAKQKQNKNKKSQRDCPVRPCTAPQAPCDAHHADDVADVHSDRSLASDGLAHRPFGELVAVGVDDEGLVTLQLLLCFL